MLQKLCIQTGQSQGDTEAGQVKDISNYLRSITWCAVGREGGLLVAKLASDKGSKALGGEQGSNSSTSNCAALQSTTQFVCSLPHKACLPNQAKAMTPSTALQNTTRYVCSLPHKACSPDQRKTMTPDTNNID